MKKALLFDLDGTLWDTVDATYKSVNIIANKYNYKEVSKDIVCRNFGNTRDEEAELFFPYLDKVEANRILDEDDILKIDILTNEGGVLYEGLEDTLAKLSEKYELYIVSNSANRKYIEAFLISSKMSHYFKGYIAASEVHLAKWDAIKKIIDDNNIVKAVYIGDTEKDLEAANKAGIPFIQCLYGFGSDLGLDNKINSITELCDSVERVFGD